MRKRALAVVVLVVVCGVSLLARQSALAKTGATARDIQVWALATVRESTNVSSAWFTSFPTPPPAAVKAIQGMAPAEKVALTNEVLTAIKSALMAPAFRTEHTARIAKQNDKAIDHGIDVNTYGRTGSVEGDVMWTTLVPMIQMMRTSFPPEALKNAYESERADLAEKIKDETGEERAKAQKDLARLNALAPLMKTNFDEFKKQYTVAKLAAAGGPDTEAKFQAATSSGQDKERIILEQTFWNRYNLTAILRQDLTDFIEQATKMDFKRPMRIQGGDLYWSDGTEMHGLTQLHRHMGAEATAAAVQFARAWLKELK